MGTLATDGNIKQLLLVVDANGYIFSSLNCHLNGLMMDRWTQQFCILANVIKGICQMIPFCEGFWLSVHLKGDKFDILVCRSVKLGRKLFKMFTCYKASLMVTRPSAPGWGR